ncbi:MAG: PD40 domain-containing protein [Bdellovibrionales bacterium]|nr:PD40 domain-containing protein [Bdellovibrionales bacterium]
MLTDRLSLCTYRKESKIPNLDQTNSHRPKTSHLLLLVFLFQLFVTTKSKASVDPQLGWQTLETPHFEVIFSEGLQDVAQFYANKAERAYDLLIPIFKEAPQKTLLILNDSTDVVNGYASFFPYPFMVVYLNLPSPLSDISSHEDWVEMLLIHEYAHILNMHPAHGIFTPLKYVFGSIVHPNGLLPRWYLEGLAVELESRLTKKGRLKSVSTEAMLRTMVKENILRNETIDRINESNIPDWPGGRRPYLLGSLLMQETLNANKEPNENIYYLNQRFSRRVPYFISGPIKDLTGMDWLQWLDRTYSKIEESSKYQLNIIQNQPQRDFKKMSFEMDSQLSPSISPDGKWLAFLAGNYYDGFGVYLSELPKGKPQKIISGSGIDKITWLPDSSAFVFSMQQPVDHYNIFNDLYIYNLKSKGTKKLTHSARAVEPEVSIDGQYVYFIKMGSGRTILSRYSFTNSHIEELWKTPLNHRLFTPTAYKLNEVIVGYKDSSGREQLFLYNDLTEEKEDLLSDFESIYSLKMTSQGLLFVSDKSGVPNLYITNKNIDRVTPLTNTSSGILNADYSTKNKKLIVSQFSKKGPQLFTVDKLKRTTPVIVPPLLSRPLTHKSDKNIKYKSDSESKISMAAMEIDQLKVYEVKDYWSSEYLLPRYWIPFIYPIEDGVLIQAMTSAGDPLGKQNYSLGLSYDSLSKDLSGLINYVNQMSHIGFSFSYGQINEYRVSTDTELQTESLSTGIFYHLSKDNAWLGNLNYIYAQTDLSANVSLKRMGLSTGITYSSSGHFNRQPRDNIFTGSLYYQKYFDQDEYINYERFFSTLRFDLKKPLKSRHTFSTQLVNSYAYEMGLGTSYYIGDTNLGANYIANLVNSSFLLRGYPSGTFSGRTMSVLNFEYAFPIKDIHSGFTTSPLFLNDTYLSLFVDVLTVDGFANGVENKRAFIDRTRWGEDIFTSTGAEFILDTTLGFHLPSYFKLALYYALDEKYQGGFTGFFTFGFGTFEPLGGQKDLNRIR